MSSEKGKHIANVLISPVQGSAELSATLTRVVVDTVFKNTVESNCLSANPMLSEVLVSLIARYLKPENSNKVAQSVAMLQLKYPAALFTGNQIPGFSVMFSAEVCRV